MNSDEDRIAAKQILRLSALLKPPGDYDDDNHCLAVREVSGASTFASWLRERTAERRASCSVRRAGRDCKVMAIVPSDSLDEFDDEFFHAVVESEGSFRVGFDNDPVALLRLLLEPYKRQ